MIPFLNFSHFTEMDINSDSFELSINPPADIFSSSTGATTKSKDLRKHEINKNLVNGISFLKSLFPTGSTSAERHADVGKKVEPPARSNFAEPKSSQRFKEILASVFMLPRSKVQQPSSNKQIVMKASSNSAATIPYTRRLLCYDMAIALLLLLILICVVALAVLLVNKYDEDEYGDYPMYDYNNFGVLREPF